MPATTLPHPRELVAFGPHAGAHRVAVRAGMSIAAPLVALWAADRTDLALYATFGAFTALYGRQHTHRPRLGMQLSAAAFLVASVTIGSAVALSPQREWLIIPVVVAVTVAAAYLSDALHWHPPGPLFPVFAVTACASVPTEPARIPLAFALAAGSAAFALLVGASGSALPVRDDSRRLRGAPPSAPPRPAPPPGPRCSASDPSSSSPAPSRRRPAWATPTGRWSPPWLRSRESTQAPASSAPGSGCSAPLSGS